jgi:ribosomal protein L19
VYPAASNIHALPSAQPENLNQSDVPDTNVGDTVSRRAAIDEIQKWKRYETTEGMIERINALPSAQIGIDVQKLLKAVYEHPFLGEYEKAVITGIIRELQEDESEVEK